MHTSYVNIRHMIFICPILYFIFYLFSHKIMWLSIVHVRYLITKDMNRIEYYATCAWVLKLKLFNFNIYSLAVCAFYAKMHLVH